MLRILVIVALLFVGGLVGCTDSGKKASSSKADLPEFRFYDHAEIQKMIRDGQKNLPSGEEELAQSCDRSELAACHRLIQVLNRSAKNNSEKRGQLANLRWSLCQKGYFRYCRDFEHSLIREREELQDLQVEFYEFAQQKCNAGFKRGCSLLYSYSSHVLQDQEKVLDAVQKGCELGDTVLCVQHANRVARSDKDKFLKLVDKICDADIEQCGVIVSYPVDYPIDNQIVDKLKEACTSKLNVCEWLARYALRRDLKDLTLEVLQKRCDLDLQRCIELGIYEVQNGIGSPKKRLNEVCNKKKAKDSKRFEFRYEKFVKRFCKSGKITGNAKLWANFRP